MQLPFIIKNQLKAYTGLIIIVIGIFFMVEGRDVLIISESFEDVVLIERLPDEKPIDYHDPSDQVEWLNEFNISQTDSDPGIVGEALGLNGYVQTRETPQEIALHIFHYDADIYFTSDDETHYKSITKNLQKVPSLKYGDIYNIKMDMENIHEGRESTQINGFSHIEFTKAGTYFAQVSVKLQNGTIVHHHSTTSAFTISDGKHEWMIDALDVITKSEEDTRPLMIASFGWTVIAIGIGLIISGISLFIGGTENRLSLVERLRA